ncbi:hypothetical protein GFY24_36930 [Nocardia sp. SYP-A9097]|uniref:hypothetical protein n=1 Tax=Nocardia sp. SYP-A9097 TaxID=2663237 RepID=UPI00129C0ECE|nr:hypothetical protein [Nocardia sp. SYP-A9097]MRH92942.1 hypothetical protein [Nocardia sp. SYP-A9097]
MSWVGEPIGYANPDYYLDAATGTEKQLRADFAKYYQLREIAPFGLTPADTAELNTHVNDLAARWGRHESPQWRRTWQTLQSAVMGWEARPDLARRNFDQLDRARAAGDLTIDDDLWRSLQQARAITGHGPGTTDGSGQNSDRRYPNLQLGTSTAPHTPGKAQESDLRTAVERTLGAPRDLRSAATIATVEQVDEVIAATDEALDAEEQLGDLDNGHEARMALLPRTIREAPVSYNYTESATWELRQAALLREVQDLACEHSNVADTFDGHDDQARITRLEALRHGLAGARRDALRAGIPAPDVDRAYILGRDGLYWSNEPSDPRLGRIAQLTAERDHARAQAASHRTELRPDTSRSLSPGNETVSAHDDFSASRAAVGADDGARIVEAIDAVLADTDVDDWVVPTDSQQVGARAPAGREMGAEL